MGWSFYSMCFMKHLVLCTAAVVAVSFFGAQAETSKTTRCSAPSVYEGEMATVNCDFGLELNPSLTTLSVDFRGADGKQKSIVNCFPSEANTSKCFYYKDWLRLRNDTIVTRYLTVEIPNATTNQSGAYSCHLVPPSGTEVPCVLEVKKRPSQSTTQQQNLSVTRQTDEATRTTAGGIQNTTKSATFGDEMPLSGGNDVASTSAGTIAAAVVASLAVLVLMIGVVAYRRCRRESVRYCCRRAASKPLETRTEEAGVHANGTHVLPRDGGDETETCHVGADHPGSDRNGSVCHNGDVSTPMLKKVDSYEDFEIVDKNELV